MARPAGPLPLRRLSDSSAMRVWCGWGCEWFGPTEKGTPKRLRGSAHCGLIECNRYTRTKAAAPPSYRLTRSFAACVNERARAHVVVFGPIGLKMARKQPGQQAGLRGLLTACLSGARPAAPTRPEVIWTLRGLNDTLRVVGRECTRPISGLSIGSRGRTCDRIELKAGKPSMTTRAGVGSGGLGPGGQGGASWLRPHRRRRSELFHHTPHSTPTRTQACLPAVVGPRTGRYRASKGGTGAKDMAVARGSSSSSVIAASA